MSCKKYKLLLSAYTDQELQDRQTRKVMEHLEVCRACQRELKELHQLKILSNGLKIKTPSSEQWKNFSDQFWARIPQKKRNNSFANLSGNDSSSGWFKIIGAAAGFLLVVAISITTFLFYPRSRFEQNVPRERSISLNIPDMSVDRAEAIINGIIHTPVEVIPANKTYDVNKNLKGLSNANLSNKELDFLYHNGFVVTSRQFPSFIALYRENQSRNIPSFITIDVSISGLFQLLARLRVDLEGGLFYKKLISFTTILAEQLISLHKEVPESCEQASLRSLAFISVSERLLGDCKVKWPPEIENKIRQMVEQELDLINHAADSNDVTIQKSPIFGFDIDYNRFKMPWNESNDENLRKYYQTLVWYNRCVFRASEASETQSALLILMAAIGDSGEGMYIWQDMNQILSIMYGEPDDPHLSDYLTAAREIYGDKITPSAIEDLNLLNRFSRKVGRVRMPRIRSELQLQTGLRIFGERSYDRDLYLQQLVHPYVGSSEGREGDASNLRVIPSIVDLGVILGHPKAIEIARDNYFQYDKYAEKVAQFQATLQKNLRTTNPWTKGGLISQAWLYQAVMQTEGRGFPVFTHSPRWDSRKLTSLLCGILNLADINSKAIFTGESKDNFEGAVDPYPEFFNRMATIIRHLERRFESAGYPLQRPAGREIVKYRKALESVVKISAKSLLGKPLNEQDQIELRNFALGWEGDYEEANLNAMSTLFHRNEDDFDSYFYAGVEPIRELWVACPGENGPYLARGGVYLLYEFQTASKILPEQWRNEKIWNKLKVRRLPWIKEYAE